MHGVFNILAHIDLVLSFRYYIMMSKVDIKRSPRKSERDKNEGGTKDEGI